MLSKQYQYKDIFLKRFINKFYFINTKNLPIIKSCKCEFHNIKNEKNYLTLFAFIEELIGILPFFVKKGFKYNFEGKKIFTKDIRFLSNSIDNILNLLKIFYLNLIKKNLRRKLVKKIGKNYFSLTLLCSNLTITFYRELFILINTVNFDIKFNIQNRFLLSYFLQNFNFF